MLKKGFALLLCLLLLPMSSLAEAAEGVRFRLTFDMDESAYPADVADIMPGIADLLEILTVEGLFAEQDGFFDLQADVTLNELERTRTDLHVFGVDKFWNIRSSLLGGEAVSISMPAMLEFAIKGYSHLGIPLQRAAILISPFVHSSGLQALTLIAEPVLFAGQGSRKISRDTLIKTARAMAEAASSDRAFRYWTEAVFMETGCDDDVTGAIAQLPEWIESFVPRDGVSVKVTDDSEVWTAGSLTLARRETDQSGAQVLSVTLPPLPGGLTITFDAATQPDGDLLHGSFDLLAEDGDGELFLRLHADGSLPVALPVTRSFSLVWDAEGRAVGGDGVHLYFEGEPTDSGLMIRQMTPNRDAVMLTMTADLSTELTVFDHVVDAGGVELLSLNGDTLTALMERIFSPLVRGLLPLIAQAPASSCQTLMDMLENSGVFGLLTANMADEDDWNEAWDDWDESLDENWDEN
ncbi:MAG: hypothetical protein J1E43_05565 [Christensenellaceae bacterium]|nr:hypothetical protein [Christensenellaceae bacterium]